MAPSLENADVPVPVVFSPTGGWGVCQPLLCSQLEEMEGGGDGNGEREREGRRIGDGEGVNTVWCELSWIASLPSTLRIALLAPWSKVFAVASPSILAGLADLWGKIWWVM